MLEAAVLCQLRHKRRRKTLLFFPPFLPVPFSAVFPPPAVVSGLPNFLLILEKKHETAAVPWKSARCRIFPSFQAEKRKKEKKKNMTVTQNA